MVASDRISAFDVVFSEGIPDKGKILSQMSLFWFNETSSEIKNHLITTDVDKYPEETKPYADDLKGRSMLVKKGKTVPYECVVRGYLEGSGWKEYQKNGTVCGHKLPKGLKRGDKLPEPIYTPATKEESGHDINITLEEMANMAGKEMTELLQGKSISVYKYAAEYLEPRGIILADTKFEFGEIDGEIILIDEILTPDSSRFWPKAKWKPGGPQASYDKQYLRDYLETLDWNKEYPAPTLPQDVIDHVGKIYMEIFTLVTGKNELA